MTSPAIPWPEPNPPETPVTPSTIWQPGKTVAETVPAQEETGNASN